MVRHEDGRGEVWLSAKEVGRILGMDPKSVGRWARAGKLPFRATLGGHRRFKESEIREIARNLRAGGQGWAP